MKMFYRTLPSVALLLTMMLLGACVKNKTTKTFTITSPVYKIKQEVYNEVKSQAATSITSAGKMYIKGNYIFLVEKNKGIHVINNSNAVLPVNESFIPVPGSEDVVVYGNIMLVDCFIDLLSIDISNPNDAKLLHVATNVFPERRFVNGYSLDSNMVIVEWISKDTTTEYEYYNQYLQNGGLLFSFDNFSTATSGGNPQGVGGSMARFTLISNYMYSVSNSTLRVLDVINPVNPQVKSTTNLGWNIETIYPVKDRLFIGSQSGMFIYNISNPVQPVYLCTFTHATLCDPVIADDHYAYITLRSGTNCQGFTNQMELVNIDDITKPVLEKTYPMANPHGLSKDSNLLFICDGSAGLKIYNASDPKNLVAIKTIDLKNTYDVITFNHRAYVSTETGLYQYDYSDIENIKLLSHLNTR